MKNDGVGRDPGAPAGAEKAKDALVVTAWELNPHRSTAADGGGPLGHPKGVTRGPYLVAVAGRVAIGAKHSRAGPVTRGPWAEQSADRRGAVHTLPGRTVIRGQASL